MKMRSVTTAIDLKQGLGDHKAYKAWRFPGGEIHFLVKNHEYVGNDVIVDCRINSSDDLMLLIMAIDCLKNLKQVQKVRVMIPYMPYQQADKRFEANECFGLRTICTILNSLPVNEYLVFDPHSDITPALLKNCEVEDNSEFIQWVLDQILASKAKAPTLLSPDAGQYKKIFKMAKKLSQVLAIETANKSRNLSSGNIDSVEISRQDFGGEDVLIVDDICVGGRTFVELAKKLKERNVGDLYLAVSHGIFSNGFTELASYFKGVFATNSRADVWPAESFGKVSQDFLKVYRLV